MTYACNFDHGDCIASCKTKGCAKTSSDGTCDASCNFEVCGYDFGDCKSCNAACTPDMVKDYIARK